MARLSFRQGIVSHGKSPRQSFFLQRNANDVDLLISPDFTTITFADNDADYLFTESVTVLNAWTDLSVASQNYYLYWELNKVTGVRTFGKTTLAPVYADTAPSSPSVGQMWFNTTSSMGDATGERMYEWNGASWKHVLRVMAARVFNFQFFSPVDNVSLESNFTGTQIGATGNTAVSVGSLVFDKNGQPILNQDNKFFTTEDVFTTGVPTGASLKINNILVPAYANEPIAAYQLVEFDDFDKISLATNFLSIDKVYGILESTLNTGDVGNVIIRGLITNEAWDFSDAINNPTMNGDVNDPIYPRADGTLTTDIALAIPDQVPVGAIVGLQTILFYPGIYGTVTNLPEQSHSDLADLDADDHTQYHNDTRGDARYYVQSVADTIFVQASGDTMTGALTLSGNPTSALHAVTKQYADALAAGIDTKFPVAVASTADIGGTYNAVGGSPAGTGEFTGVDISALDGDLGTHYNFDVSLRILVKDQTDAKQNGIYEIKDGIASPPNSVTLIRAGDQNGDPEAEVSEGNYTLVTGGAANRGNGYQIIGTSTRDDGIIDLNTDDIIWAQNHAAVAYTAGDNIDISAANVISVIDASAGGTVDALTWNSNAINTTAGSPVEDNQVLVFDAVTVEWKNEFLTVMRNDGNTGSITIDPSGNITVSTEASTTIEATDLTVNGVSGSPTAAAELHLGLNGSSFTSKITHGTLTSNTNFTLPTDNGTSGDYLATNGAGVTSWTTNSLDNLSDVDLTGSPAPTTGNVLTFDGNNWVHGAASATSLAALTDVNVSGSPLPSDGDVLVYQSGVWVNGSATAVNRPQMEQITIGGSPVSDVVNTTVPTTSASGAPLRASLQVFRNGVLQREDIDGASPIAGDFIVTGANQLTFASGVLQPADELIIFVFE